MIDSHTISHIIMQPWFIQSVGYVALFFAIMGLTFKHMVKILRAQSVGSTLFSIQMLMLGNLAAFAMCFSAGLRAYMVSFSLSKKQKLIGTIILMIPAWSVALYLQGFVWQTIVVFFPIPIIIGEVIGRVDLYRYMFLVNSVLWLTYSLFVGSHGLLISSGIMFVTCIYTIAQAFIEERTQKQAQEATAPISGGLQAAE